MPPSDPASPRSQPVPLRRAAAALIGSPGPEYLHTARPFVEPLPRPPRLRFTCAAEFPALGAPAASIPPPAPLHPRPTAPPDPRRPALRSLLRACLPGKTWHCPPRLRRLNRLEPSVAWIRWKKDNNPDPCVRVCARVRVPRRSALQHLLVEKQQKPPGIGIKIIKNLPGVSGLFLLFRF